MHLHRILPPRSRPPPTFGLFAPISLSHRRVQHFNFERAWGFLSYMVTFLKFSFTTIWNPFTQSGSLYLRDPPSGLGVSCGGLCRICRRGFSNAAVTKLKIIAVYVTSMQQLVCGFWQSLYTVVSCCRHTRGCWEIQRTFLCRKRTHSYQWQLLLLYQSHVLRVQWH